MKRKILKIAIASAIIINLLASTIFASNNNDKKLLMVNGESSKIKPVIVNDSAMLPLRDTLDVFKYDNITWDHKTKTVTIVNGDMDMKLTIGEDVAQSKYGLDEGTDWYLTQPPVIVQGRTYLPLRFLSDAFFSEIKYEHNTVFLNTPFKYDNGTWYETNNFKWKEVSINNSTIKKHDDTIYAMFTTQRESLVVNPAALFALNAQGKYKLLSWIPALVSDYKVANNSLYYQFNTSVLSGYDIIHKTSLDDVNHTRQLGRDDFSYGSKIALNHKDQESSGFQRLTGNWETKPEGVYAVGFAREAAVENIVKDLSLLKESYGYYLLDDKGNHRLIKSLEIE